jgi:hypothetical protein
MVGRPQESVASPQTAALVPVDASTLALSATAMPNGDLVRMTRETIDRGVSGTAQRQAAPIAGKIISPDLDFLFSVREDGPLPPEDVDIGPLAGPRDAVGAQAGLSGALGFAYAFWDAVSRGTDPSAYLHAGKAKELLRFLAQLRTAGLRLKSYRIGAPRADSDGSARLNLKLESASGRACGEMTLLRDEKGEWRVYDLDLPLSDLGDPATLTKDIFTPDVYNMAY